MLIYVSSPVYTFLSLYFRSFTPIHLYIGCSKFRKLFFHNNTIYFRYFQALFLPPKNRTMLKTGSKLFSFNLQSHLFGDFYLIFMMQKQFCSKIWILKAFERLYFVFKRWLTVCFGFICDKVRIAAEIRSWKLS